MDQCQACRTALPTSARFCPACGLPTVDEQSNVDMFLSSDADSAGDAINRPVVRQPIALTTLFVAAVLTVAIWTGLRQPMPASDATQEPQSTQPEPNAPDSQLEANVPNEESTSGAAVAPSNGTSTDSGSEPAADDLGATQFFDGEFASDVFANLSVVGPLLPDEDVGYRLLASSEDQLFDIDLDSGEMTRHRITIDPVGVLGDELIAFDPTRGFVALQADNLDAQGRIVFAVPEVAATDRAVSVENLLRAATRPPNTLLAEFNRPEPGTGRLATQLYEVNISSGRFTATSIAVDPRPDTPHQTRYGLAALDGGGLFEASGNSYQKIADGQALLLGVNYAIARDCPEPGTCRTYWIDRSSGLDVQRPLPTASELRGSNQGRRDGAGTDTALLAVDELDADATVVMIKGPGDTGSGFYDVDRGQRLAILDPLSLEFAVGPLGRSFGALSPDGRWMALPVGGSIVLYDRDAELLYRRGSGPSAVLEQFVFVPNGR